METVPTLLDPAIPLLDASIYEKWWAYHAMSGGCVAGCVWGWDLDAHNVDVDPVGDPETMGMEAIPTDPDLASPAPDATNQETW